MRESLLRRRTFIKQTVVCGGLVALGPILMNRTACAASDRAKYLLGGITWVRNTTFRIQDGNTVLYVDTYGVKKGTNDADIICACHPHEDHCTATSLSYTMKENAVILTEPDTAALLKKYASQVTVVAPGDVNVINGIRIQAIPAYTVKPTSYPHKKTWLGFHITLSDGRTIYHAGESDLIPEMADIRADVALLPIAGTAMMIPSEAAEAVREIHPEVAVPTHYGSVIGSVADANKFVAEVGDACEVVVFATGESYPPVPASVSNWAGL